MQIKYFQNIQFSISIRTLVDVLLFNNIFETNKIEQINCHVLFKQVHTMLFVSALWKKCVAKSDGWMSLGFYVPFKSISVISGRWKGELERLCAMKCYVREESLLMRDSNPRPGDPKLGPLGSQS